MRTRRLMVWLGSALVATGALGCSADEEPAGLVNAGGGGAGGAGQAGTAGTGGSSGAMSTAGSAGSAGSVTMADAALDQSVGSDAKPEAAAETGPSSDAGTDAGDAGSKSFALFVGSDFIGGGIKLTAVDWATKQIAGSTVFANVALSDAIPVVSGGRPFMIERSDSKLIVLQQDKPWLASKTIDLSAPKVDAGPDAGSVATNPVAVVSTGAKAYVPLYFTNRIAIVNVESGTVTGSVDLSSFLDPADTDGRVEVSDGVYDPATHRAYFLLGAIPQNEKGIEPDRVAVCITAAPSIVAVDTTTDQVIDINGDAGGKGFSLIGHNPTAFVPDLANGRLLVVEAGCYELEGGAIPDGGPAQATVPRIGRGIESLALASGTSSWLYTHADSTRLSGVVLVDATHAYISADDEFYTTHWYPWNPASGATHGAEATTLPQLSPHYVGGNLIVGFSPQYVDGGTLDALISFNVTSSVVTTLVPNLFGDPSYSGEYNGWALLP